MRLTLRIILSYLNQVLGPEDSRTIESQIAQDPSTAQLIRRIQEAVRHTALQAGNRDISTLDPNLVAEYLDNDLSAEEVLDFEKICLESDGSLAEVASCYHTLTEVLSGVAPPEPHLRQRLCDLAGPSQNDSEKNERTDDTRKIQTEKSEVERGDISTINTNQTNAESKEHTEKRVGDHANAETSSTQMGGMLLHGIPIPPPVPRRNSEARSSSSSNDESQTNDHGTREHSIVGDSIPHHERSTEERSGTNLAWETSDETISNNRSISNDMAVNDMAINETVANDTKSQNTPETLAEDRTENLNETISAETSENASVPEADSLPQSSKTFSFDAKTDLLPSSPNHESSESKHAFETAESVETTKTDLADDSSQTTTTDSARSSNLRSNLPIEVGRSSSKSTKSSRSVSTTKNEKRRKGSEIVWGDPDDERMSFRTKILLCLFALTMIVLAGAGGFLWYRNGGFQFLASANQEKHTERTHEDNFVSETAGLQDKDLEEGYLVGRETELERHETEPSESPSTQFSTPSSDSFTSSDSFETVEPSIVTSDESDPSPENEANSTQSTSEEEDVSHSENATAMETDDSTEGEEPTETSNVTDRSDNLELPVLDTPTDESDSAQTTETAEDLRRRAPRVPNLLIPPQLEDTPKPEPQPEPEPIVVAEPEPEPEPIALLQSQNAVVVRISIPKIGGYEGDMVRLSTQTPIFPGDRLVTLPTFRAEVKIGDTVSIESVGEAALRMPDYRGQAPIPFTLERGRFILKTPSETGLDLRCVLGDQPGELHLENDQTIVALEITREIPGQQDPEKAVGGFLVQLSCTEGSARWTPEGTETTPLEIARLRQLQISCDPTDLQKIQREVLELDEIPTWVELMPITPLETYARDSLEEKLRPDNKGIISKLSTIARDDTRRETRTLARRAMRALDQYDIESYILYHPDDIDQWDSCFTALASDIQRSQYSASKIRGLLERRFAAAGNDIYQLLWKYRGLEEPSEEALKAIIAKMKHNKPVVRSAAFRALTLLYPGDTRGYSPDKLEASRNAAIRRWERFLKLESTVTDKAASGTGSIGGNGPVSTDKAENGQLKIEN